MSMKIEEIEALTIDEVKQHYNQHAIHTIEGLAFWQTIYNMKTQTELNATLKSINEQMLKYTKQMIVLTFIVLVATIANVVVTILK